MDDRQRHFPCCHKGCRKQMIGFEQYCAQHATQPELVRALAATVPRSVAEGLYEALGKYSHCRHATPDCFCVREARSALEAARKVLGTPGPGGET